ncbi:MAG: hypothetical protein ACOZAO_00695 [Patescibacteria group bacterium]
MNSILLNNKKFNFSLNELPCLLVGQEKSGVSAFSISLITNLFLQGHKVLFLTAFPMATENFLNQVEEYKNDVGIVATEEDLQKFLTKQAILIKSGDTTLFRYVFSNLIDIKERVVFIKNIDYFDSRLIEIVLPHKNLILSGVLEECPAKETILEHRFNSYVTFSPSNLLKTNIPLLEKYQGYYFSDVEKGFVALQM